MNVKLKLIALSLVSFVFFFSGCTEEDLNPPVITDFEIGIDNSMVAYPGSDLHFDAQIVAEAKIDRIEIGIHPEGEHHEGLKTGSSMDEVAEGWEFEYTWTEFSGLKNTEFHEHIDVPEDAETGHYHVHLKVIDMEGNLTGAEGEFELQNP